MASQGSNSHHLKYKIDQDQSYRRDDISQLFQDADEDENSGKRLGYSTRLCASLFETSELIAYRAFYFFFYAATALFAYLPLYYKKSLLLDHWHVGILMGIRPFCGFIGAPILGSFADKFDKYKTVLYTGLLTYILVYLSITFVNGVPKDCNVQGNNKNTTHESMNQFHGKLISEDISTKHKLSLGTMKMLRERNFAGHLEKISQQNGAIQNKKQHRMVQIPDESFNINKRELLGKPLYFTQDVKQLPLKHFRLVSEDDFNSNQAESSKDSKDGLHGDKGFHTITVDNSTQATGYDQYWLHAPETAGEETWPIDVYRKEPLENRPLEEEKIRLHIFMILLLLMLAAELIGSPIHSLADTATLQTLKKEPYKYGHQIIWSAVGFGCMSILAGGFLHYTVSKKDEINNCPGKMGKSYKPVFYSCCALLIIAFFTTFKFKFRTYERKNTSGCSFFHCFTHFRNVEYLLFAFLAFFTGLGAGLTDSFLFVHLIRLGATPLVLVVTTTVQSVSKITFFYLSPMLILKYGYFPILNVGMLTSVVTFLYYSFLVSPWMVVPVELLSGLSSSCVWAVLVSYVGAPPKIGATLQGIVHSLHIGLGRGIGGLFGGMILLSYGFDILFRSFSLLILLVVALVFFIRYRREEVEPIWTKLWDYSPIAPYDAFSDEE